MENASKALIMAATVLVGVLILSIGAYLFSIFGNFSAETTEKLYQKDIDEFNAKFYKYQSYKDETGNWKNTCRAQDVVSVANLAKENNSRYEYTQADQNTGYYYINVIVKLDAHNKYDNFEINTLEEYQQFIKSYSGYYEGTSYKVYYFKCIDIIINDTTKRVRSVTFELLS